jgi:Flp pilus assembly protein TadD
VVERGIALAVILSTLAGCAAYLRWGMPMGRGAPREFGMGVSPSRLPEAAVAFLRATEPEGRVFNILGFGGYLIHELWPERQVYVDGRLDIYPPGFLDSYGMLMTTGEGWDAACGKYGITMALVDYRPDRMRGTGLRARLRTDPDWECVYFGDNVLVYARRVPENAAILERFGCPFDPGVRSVQSILDFVSSASAAELARALAAREAMLDVTPEERSTLVVLGQLLDACGRSAEGAGWLRRAVELGPTSRSARLLLASALGRAGEFAEAHHELSLVLAMAPTSVEALVIKAGVERQEGDLDAALQTLEGAAALEPDNYLVNLRLGEVCVERGESERAERCFQRILRRRPGDPTALRKLESVGRHRP